MMPPPLVVINAVGLTPSLVGPDTPHLSALALDGFRATLTPVLPAVTCTAQATMLTGTLPREHGIVGNGWYFRDLAEVMFWRQSNRLVAGEKLWDAARRARPDLKTAVLLWWFNMYSSAELSVTVRPIYPADGRKIPALYSQPTGLGASLEAELGRFPFFQFWGPNAGLASSDWIARAGLELFRRERPGLSLIYLPHLDYDFQRFGPSHPRARDAVRELDRVAGVLTAGVRAEGAEVVVVSEYGIEQARAAVHLNRALRQHGLLAVRDTLGRELLDPGASRAIKDFPPRPAPRLTGPTTEEPLASEVVARDSLGQLWARCRWLRRRRRVRSRTRSSSRSWS
jgi:predicted AlkP superfamily pyrophosphatase or phosphodiesterase